MAKILEVGVYELLEYEASSSDEIKEIKNAAREVVNELSKPIDIEFEVGKMPKINGNVVKKMMAEEGYLSGLVRAVQAVVNASRPSAVPPPPTTPKAPKSLAEMMAPPPPKEAKRAKVSRMQKSLNKQAVAGIRATPTLGEHPTPDEPERTPEEQFDIDMTAMEQLIATRFDVRLATAFECALDHWQYMTAKDPEVYDPAKLPARRLELHRLGKEFADAVINLCGTDLDSSYLHNLVYDLPNVITHVGHVLRVSMEGFEHANKVTKAIFKGECSRGGARRERHAFVQALEHRRSGTMAAASLGYINHTASERKYTKPDEEYTRFYDVDSVKVELAALKQEITWQVLKQHARGKLQDASIKIIARLLEPSLPKGYVWPKLAPDAMAKRAPGGNGNNRVTVTLEQQLLDEGVEPLNASTFRWADCVFEGVPRKGEAEKINHHVDTLFDNTWLAQNSVRALPTYSLAPSDHTYAHGFGARRSLSCARICARSRSKKPQQSSGRRCCRHSKAWSTSMGSLSPSSRSTKYTAATGARRRSRSNGRRSTQQQPMRSTARPRTSCPTSARCPAS